MRLNPWYENPYVIFGFSVACLILLGLTVYYGVNP